MDPVSLGLLFAAAGLGKSALIDAPRAERQRKVQAETTRWSPWTNMAAQAPVEADPFGSALQFGTTGAMLGQGFETAAAKDKFNSEYLDLLKKDMANKAAVSEMGGTANRWPSSIPPISSAKKWSSSFGGMLDDGSYNPYSGMNRRFNPYLE